MDETPHGPAVDDAEVTYCYGHPDTPTKLRCSRCDRPICGRCAIPASVGQHCPECVAEARRTRPRVRTAMARQAPGVMGILILNVVVYAAQQLEPSLTGRFGLFPPAIADGEWWRLFTPMVLHSPDSALHLLMNSFVLWVYGPHVERVLGTMRFVAMYVIAGFAGSVASYAFSPARILGVGASGAIFGVAGALLVMLYRRRSSSFVYAEMRNLMLFIGLNLFLGFVIPGIDIWAHIGGLLGGAVVGFGFDPENRTTAPIALITSVAVIATGLLLLAWRTSELGGNLLG
jgi:membrane associated rhomboid family serine protease